MIRLRIRIYTLVYDRVWNLGWARTSTLKYQGAPAYVEPAAVPNPICLYTYMCLYVRIYAYIYGYITLKFHGAPPYIEAAVVPLEPFSPEAGPSRTRFSHHSLPASRKTSSFLQNLATKIAFAAVWPRVQIGSENRENRKTWSFLHPSKGLCCLGHGCDDKTASPTHKITRNDACRWRVHGGGAVGARPARPGHRGHPTPPLDWLST